MLVGVLFGVLACALWGIVYMVPQFLGNYDPIVIAMGRFTVYGIGAAFLAIPFRKELKKLSFKDWRMAFSLSFFGNAVYYVFLCWGIQYAGAPVAGMLMALIPVLVALIANKTNLDQRTVVPWSKLCPPLLMIFVGLCVGNIDEFKLIKEATSQANFWVGTLCATVSMLLWTWFPIKNAQWLISHPKYSPLAWTTAQGMVITPFTLLFYLVVNWVPISTSGQYLGSNPELFATLMIVSGLLSGWGGMACWNLMSARLPAALGGQMIVFETIFSVLYTLIYRKESPTFFLCVGLALLIVGVLLSLKVFREAEVRS